MCGIFGVITAGHQPERVGKILETAQRMQQHRGPDARGTLDRKSGAYTVGLCHQRLSILDLTDAGTQPMTSHSGRYTIIYNGEIYNYLELSTQFSLSSLRSGSDTEVILECIEKLGIERALPYFNGMWAFLIADWQEHRVYFSRDRAGVKPLYYLLDETNNELFFASEIKTLVATAGKKFTVNKTVAGRYLAQSLQDFDEGTFFNEIKAVPRSSFGYINLQESRLTLSRSTNYWIQSAADLEPYTGTFNDYAQELKATLTDACKLRLRSDVPVGLTLSGGVDSSILATVMSDLLRPTGQKVRALSAVSPGHSEDESPFIDVVASHLDIQPQKVTLNQSTPDELRTLLSECTYFNDAPLASLSNVLFYQLMQALQSSKTTVIFSGQGADELFCGYRKYPFFYIQQLIKEGRYVRAFHAGISFFRNDQLTTQFRLSEAKRYIPGIRKKSSISEHADSINLGLGTDGIAARQWQDYSALSVPYLLHYEDRMSMACGKEVRLPYLDYRIVELGLRAPTNFKLHKGWTKYCLRSAFNDSIPPQVLWRKDKKGFTNPQDHLLRTILREDLEALISKANHSVFDIIPHDSFRKKAISYLQGDDRIWFREIFSTLALSIWMDTFSVSLQ